MILRSFLMLVAGFFLFPLGLALAVAFPSLNDHHPLMALVLSILLISMGPALLITGAVNLLIGICRAVQSRN